ncbi:hypothetical protein GCM10020369_01670 [Cryptosporangium minutisporangium]|uniref:Uncharacterized protein n=1 Tax=Cryptosporangium minutisporangium TaxID=113569 RepID=A0ABP6SPR4_9ACTN
MVLMSLAGTLLPLALAHRWGRLWPAWFLPLRGRAVPRWLVLGTGLFVGGSLTAYFGVVGMTRVLRGFTYLRYVRELTPIADARPRIEPCRMSA